MNPDLQRYDAQGKVRVMKKLSLLLTLTAAFCIAAVRISSAAQPRVLEATYSGIINPACAEYIGDALEKANYGYSALVIRLDTPGGLDLSMRDIIKGILASRVPVIVYVAPAGARAASAGVYIGMSAHLLVMSPSTNIGAAHPVMIGAENSAPSGKKGGDSIMESKMMNDAAAYLKSISRQRGRNADWAFKAVTQSASLSADEAVKEKVADFMASDINDLLAKADGRELPGLGKLKLSGAQIEPFEITGRQKLLAEISDPNIAMILMSAGAAGILIEMYNPGLILPGIIGGISLLLGFYSFHTLSANISGVLLILLGIILFIAEIHVASYGMLTIGGITSILLGALMLFKGVPAMGLSISLGVLASTIGGMLVVVALIGWITIRAQLRKISAGPETLIGQKGIAKTTLTPGGTVLVAGELWNAVSSGGNIPAGAAVKIVSRDGFTLTVTPG